MMSRAYALTCISLIPPATGSCTGGALPVSTVPTSKGRRTVKLLWLPSFKLWRVLKRGTVLKLPPMPLATLQGLLANHFPVFSWGLCHTPNPKKISKMVERIWKRLAKNQIRKMKAQIKKKKIIPPLNIFTFSWTTNTSSLSSDQSLAPKKLHQETDKGKMKFRTFCFASGYQCQVKNQSGKEIITTKATRF